MKKLLFVFCFSCAISNVSLAQSSGSEWFDSAKNLAYTQKYTEAKAILDSLLTSDKDHYDYRFLLGQVYAWSGQYEPSISIFQQLVDGYPPNSEAYEMLAKAQLWNATYLPCVAICDQGLTIFPENESLKITKARALAEIGDKDGAMAILEELLSQTPENTEAAFLLKQLSYKEPQNAIAVDYEYTYFTNAFNPWHTASVAYKRKTSWGSMIGRLSQTHRFGANGTQLEIDAYPKINKRSYAYLNVGASNRTVFPHYRFGAEYFRLIRGNFELSAGIRGLYFSPIYVNVFTLQAGHYFRHYWLSARGFLANVEGHNTLTGTFTFRNYLQNADQYVTLYAESGNTPLSIISLNEIRRLETNGIAIDYQHPLQERTLLLGAKATYNYEVYPEIRATNRFAILFSIAKRF